MKRAIIMSVVFLATMASAHADHYEMNYHDLIRPHGQPRSAAIHQADIDFCYDQTGLDRAAAATPALKKCMLGRGYLWQSTRLVRTAPESIDDTYIDPDAGLSCRNTGGVAICDPPQGTVKYFDPDSGL